MAINATASGCADRNAHSPETNTGVPRYQMAYEVADALLFGKPGPCPICDGAGALRSVYPLTEKEPAVQVGWEENTAFPYASAAMLPKTDAFGCGAAVPRDVDRWRCPVRVR